MSEFLQDAYSGTATLGKISSYVGAFIGTLFGIVLIILGIYVAVKKPIKKEKSKDENTSTNYIAAAVFIGFGFLIIISSWITIYLTYNYKVFASAEGIGTLTDLIQS